MKPKYKVHPIMLFAFFVNAVVAGILTYRNYMVDNMVFAYIFLFLAVFLLTMTITGLKHNKSLEEDRS